MLSRTRTTPLPVILGGPSSTARAAARALLQPNLFSAEEVDTPAGLTGSTAMTTTGVVILAVDDLSVDQDWLQSFTRQAPNHALVVMTQHWSAAEAHQVLELGAQDYLEIAALDPERLTRALEMALLRRRAEPCPRGLEGGSTAESLARRQAEQALLESEARLREAEQVAGLGHWSYDAATDTVDWSAQMFELFERERHLGPLRLAAFAELIHPEDRPVFSERTQHALTEGTAYHGDWRFRAADGSYRWLRCRTRPSTTAEGVVTGLLGTAVDITDRKLAEESLRHVSEELEDERQRLEDILRNLPAGVMLIDPSTGRLGYANAEAERILQRSPLVGEMLQDIAAWATPEDEAPDVLTALAERFLTRGEGFRRELPFRTAEGQDRCAMALAAPLHDARGRVTAGIVAFVDITEQRSAENALREADRRKDDFLATLAHELRNPLGAIRNGIALWTPDPSSRQELWLRQMMDRQSRQLQRLIDDLLDVSRITRGKIVLRKEWLDLGEIVERVLAVVRDEIAQRRQDLRVRVPEEPVLLQADPTRIEQMLVNLLSNATKYTPEHGRIELDVEQHDDEITVLVRDNGIGIAKESLVTIFEKFAQEDTSIHRSHGGLGLGLTLVKELAILHGGFVTAASEGLGRGATFELHLPTMRAYESDVVTPKAERSGLKLWGKRILLVDDDQDFAHGLAALLERAGHFVEVSFDGPTALERCRATTPDVLLLDIGLPGIDGREIARRLRQTQLPPVIIGISGLIDPHEPAPEAMFDDIFPKPLDNAALLRQLDALGRSVEQPVRQ